MKNVCLGLSIEEVVSKEVFCLHFSIFNLQREASGLRMKVSGVQGGEFTFHKMLENTSVKTSKRHKVLDEVLNHTEDRKSNC